MQFYCQNTIWPKKYTKLCLRVEKWEQVGITSFFNFYTKLAESSFCVVFAQNPSMFLFFHDSSCAMCTFPSSTNNFTHAQTLSRMSSLSGRMNIAWVNIEMLYWMQENQTATYFLRSRLFTYDIMKNFNCNQYKTSNIGNFQYKKKFNSGSL